jgi:N-acetylglucosamine malate deacetylase 2
MELREILNSNRHDILLIAPHPDDEVIGAGSKLKLWGPRVTVVHVTNGSPNNLYDAQNNGFSSAADYAECRRQELEAALRLADIPMERTLAMEVPDQESSFRLLELTSCVANLIVDFQPDFIVTVPYEGGHPDHDSTAFAVQEACHCLAVAPRIIEMSAYHNRNGCFHSGEFLGEGHEAQQLQLSADETELKEQMFRCFNSQRVTLDGFRKDIECFRWAPEYDFTQPPHAGSLYYEMFDWGMTGERWRSLAAAALDTLYYSAPELALA